MAQCSVLCKRNLPQNSIRSWIHTNKGAMESFAKDGGYTWSPIEADALEFERTAYLRDQIKALKALA